MTHRGDFDTGAVIYGKFTTFRPSTGAPFTLAGTPALSVYKDNSTTQSTTGVTLTTDFDSVTGFNHFAIDTSADGTFYSAGSFFDIVITTGTVDSVSVVGSVVASFTLRKDSSLKPTTAGRTLDVSAGGEAGLDWANIGSPTTAVNLSATNIDVDQVVASVSGAVGSVTSGVTVTTNNDKTGYSLTQTFPTNFSALAITAGGAVTVGTNNDKTGYTASTVSDKTGYSLTAGTGLGNQTANITGTITTATNLTTNNDKTGYSIATGGLGTGDIDATALNEIADAILDRVLSAGADSGADTTSSRTVRQALRALRNRVAIAAGTMTVYKENDTTASWTSAITTTAGNPVSESNPT